MTITIRKSLAALTILGAASLGLVAAAPAQASALGNVPSCVSLWQKSGKITKTGYAYNGCGVRMNMKIVWAHGSDGRCWSVAPRETISSTVSRGPRTFDGAKYC
ncbi:hypothetical protein [Nonomuraea rhizosphaerae]|uniref:hypothetical protein n=1 Tax=Nonomuraea rhizosphaerae TaxID=2665663 RepID=UPI001C5CF056|nr:hypothetical protein [Nonomuraea rhizosphaerae]